MDWEIALIVTFVLVIVLLFVVSVIYLGISMTVKKDEPKAIHLDNIAASIAPAPIRPPNESSPPQATSARATSTSPAKPESKKPPSTGTTLAIVVVCVVAALAVFVIPLVFQFHNIFKAIPPWR